MRARSPTTTTSPTSSTRSFSTRSWCTPAPTTVTPTASSSRPSRTSSIWSAASSGSSPARPCSTSAAGGGASRCGATETVTEMERASWEVLDVENLRLHYARTCRHWVERLRARADEARAIVGERTYRTWLLYLTCSAVAFEAGSIGLYQVLARKQWDRAGGSAPTTREDLYAER